MKYDFLLSVRRSQQYLLQQFIPFHILLLVILAFSVLSVFFANGALGAEPLSVKVGFYENYPKIFIDKNNNVSGFWPNLLGYIAERENWKIEYIRGTWSEGLARLKQQKIDIMPDVAFTDKRSELYTFSDKPVLLSWSRLYVNKKNESIVSIQDLKDKKIAALKDSVNLEGAGGLRDLLRGFNISTTLVGFDSYHEVFQAIAENRVDAGITNRNFGNKNEKNYYIKRTSIIFQPISMKFAFPRDTDTTQVLVNKINLYMVEMAADEDSPYYQLLEKYFEVEIAEKKIEILPRWLTATLKSLAGVGIILVLIIVVSRLQVRKKTAELQNELKVRQRAEERFRLIFEHAPVSLWHEDFSKVRDYIDQLRKSGVSNFQEYFKMNPEKVKECLKLLEIIDVNQASLNLHCANDKKEMLDSFSDTFTEDSFRFFREELVALANSETSFQTDAVLQTLDGIQKNVVLQLVIDDTNPDSMDGYVALTDITERKKSEEALNKSEKELRAAVDIINRSPSVAFLWKNTENWPVEYVSNNVLELLGYSVEEFLSLEVGYSDVIHPDDRERVAEEVRYFSEKKGIMGFVHKPYRVIAKNGDEKWIHDATRIRIDEQGFISHYEGIIIDITDRIRAEEAESKMKLKLHQYQKMESIGLMAGGVAHDLNNILAGIVGYPELILEDLPEGHKLRKPLEAMHESGKRATAVVADLLTVARDAASIREQHNLNSLVEEYLNSPEGIKLKSLHLQVTYRHRLDATHPAISCSPVHIKKCLMNLVTNAAEAISDTGTVTVSTRNEDIDAVTGAELDITPGEYIILSVQDTGGGISKTDLAHIFEPFYTRKTLGRSGTGLGLTVVWNTMEEHDGKVIVDSDTHRTCFQLYFPVVTETNKIPDSVDSTKEVINGDGEHILVVDDEQHIRDIASRMLKSLNYKVDVASSGEEAIQFVKDTEFNLIVLDMLMEPGMNGCQTYEEILKLYPNQQAIVASGFSETDDVKATIKFGASVFIKKPYSKYTLGQAVKEALNS